MAERGEERHIPQIFSFICPEERIDDARTLLGKIKGVKLSTEPADYTTRFVLDPDTRRGTFVGGVELSGIAHTSKRIDIARGLIEAGIAGYSISNPILFGDANPERFPQHGKAPYKPEIIFKEGCLLVGFDKSLSTPQDELDQFPQLLTWFGVNPENPKLFVELLEAPIHVLRAVADGLRSYQEDEGLTPEQRNLLALGVSHLEDLYKTDN